MTNPVILRSKGNILVVDDTPENLKLLMHTLDGEGYTVRPAGSGKLALSGARRMPPDLILLDITMPEMDGYEVCAALKDDPALRDIPVIFVSALGEAFDKVKAFESGGVDYVTKPFQIEEMLARIGTHLALRRLQKEHEKTIEQLRTALDKITLLGDLIPICMHCKKIRDDKGYWDRVENYIAKSAEAQFSHSICEACLDVHYPEYSEEVPTEIEK